MPTMAHSVEASAAERFVRATRRVDSAFRVVRSDEHDSSNGTDHAFAMLQLEEALDELAEAQYLFDASVGKRSQPETEYHTRLT